MAFHVSQEALNLFFPFILHTPFGHAYSMTTNIPLPKRNIWLASRTNVWRVYFHPCCIPCHYSSMNLLDHLITMRAFSRWFHTFFIICMNKATIEHVFLCYGPWVPSEKKPLMYQFAMDGKFDPTRAWWVRPSSFKWLVPNTPICKDPFTTSGANNRRFRSIHHPFILNRIF